MANADQAKVPLLEANYNSPTSTHAFKHKLPTVDDSSALSTEQKTAYLSTLRSSITTLQAEINAFLTQKMDEDNAKAAGDSKGTKRKGVDEGKEEENYGEEVMEEDTT